MMIKLKKNLFKVNNLLSATFFCVVAFVFYLGFYIFALVDKPDRVDEELLSTRGKFLAIAAGTQRGIVFIVKEEGDGRLIKLLAIPGSTNVQSGFSSSVGKDIVVRHYGKLVVSCRIDGVEFCVSSCASAYECRMNLFYADAASLEKMVRTMFVLTVLCLVAYLLKINLKRTARGITRDGGSEDG